MGNSLHASGKRSSATRSKRHRLKHSRRLSEPANEAELLLTTPHKATTSTDEHNLARPKIQVNGRDSTEEYGPNTSTNGDAAERRLKFLSSSNTLAVRSLEECHLDGGVEQAMKHLKDRARSLSPLKQLRTYSFRSIPSEESYFSEEQQASIRQSWSTVLRTLEEGGRDFGYSVFSRLFSRAPHLKRSFGIEEFDSLEDVPSDHPIHRHSHIFTKLIDLVVRNVDELETEIAPAIFRYGQRHYHTNAREQFNEQSVRLFCSQVVCAVVDLATSHLDLATSQCLDAWVELMRYLGGKMLDGFQFDHLASKKKLSINTTDRVIFIL